MNWDFDGNLPIYLQIMQTIKTSIVSGRYGPGEKLPSVRELALDAGVNPNTMQRALAQLEQEGFVFSQSTAGRFITKDRQKLRQLSQELAVQYIRTMVESILALGLPPEQIPLLLEEYLAGRSGDRPASPTGPR